MSESELKGWSLCFISGLTLGNQELLVVYVVIVSVVHNSEIVWHSVIKLKGIERHTV